MAVSSGPNIKKENLFLYIDAENPKCYSTGSNINDLTGINRLRIAGTLVKQPNRFDFVQTGYISSSIVDFTANNDFTVSIWIKSSFFVTGSNIISNKNYWTTGGEGFAIANISNPSSPYFYVYSSAGNAARNPSMPGQYNWTNLTLVKTGSNIDCYKNGIYIGGNTGIGTVTDISNRIFIGQYPNNGGNQYSGSISTVLIYKEGLNSSQVYNLYKETKKGSYGI